MPWLTFDLDGTSFSLPDDTMSAELARAGDGQDVSASAAAGNRLSYECLEPLRLWRLVYHGEMQLQLRRAPAQVLAPARMAATVVLGMDVKVEMVSELFFYQRGWDKVAVTKSMSAEPWTPSFFRALRPEHQEHYEVGTAGARKIRIAPAADREDGDAVLVGGLEGPAGHRELEVDLGQCRGFRDHSFGKRDWTSMRRYLWFGTVSLDPASGPRRQAPIGGSFTNAPTSRAQRCSTATRPRCRCNLYVGPC